MPFCYAPWTNIDIDPAGKISPCCKFQRQYYDQVFDVQKDSIQDYVNSDMLRSIKQYFLDDQWPQGCERCRIEEQNNIPSKRQMDQQRWRDHYQRVDVNRTEFLTASVAFGNTCNLKCITCSSYASSRWQQEYREIYAVDWPHVKFYRDDFVGRFMELAPNLYHLDIPGGEPFLSGVEQQQELLQHYAGTGRANQMTLHYTTNASIFPDDSWWQLWDDFKEIDLQVSLDGIKQRLEYIRYPADWSLILSNIHQYIGQSQRRNNFRISVSHTVSAYNIFYLDEFVSWCYTIGLPRPWLGRVHNPAHMRPTVWPEHTRKMIIDKLRSSQHEDVQAWAELVSKHDDSQHFDLFRQKLVQHDQYRGLNFQNTFPELASHI